MYSKHILIPYFSFFALTVRSPSVFNVLRGPCSVLVRSSDRFVDGRPNHRKKAPCSNSSCVCSQCGRWRPRHFN